MPRLHREMMQPMRAASTFIAVLAAAALPVVVTACAGNGVDALAMIETEPGILELTTTCADGLSADVEEAVDEVRITDLQGDAIDGDCNGLLRIELTAPLQDRQVVVGGERWVDLPATCPWGVIGPPDLGERLESCASE
ncbi:MAG: hypothetical protein R8G01_22300 [Ilumatobacteraceae bacterium]|nr:hypothetical protein [Ilumatobacteraceae bacterium]